jgi:hypothetical protein
MSVDKNQGSEVPSQWSHDRVSAVTCSVTDGV